MDAEGGKMIHRDTRSRKLAVVVVVQNVLVVACLAVTAYVYWTQGRFQDVQDVHIQAEAVPGIDSSGTLKMMHIHSKHMMGLNDTSDGIYTNCTGFYLLYLDVCYLIMDGDKGSALLQLQVDGSKAIHSPFELHTSNETCRGLHSIIDLKAKQEVSLQLISSSGGFKMKTMTVDLRYLRGDRCEN